MTTQRIMTEINQTKENLICTDKLSKYYGSVNNEGVLTVRELKKYFGTVKAVDGLSFTIL